MTNVLANIQNLSKTVMFEGQSTEKNTSSHLTTPARESGAQMLQILKSLDFTINEHSSFAITGESGSGKSTLLSLLAGLDLPSQGDIVMQGEVLNHKSEEDRATWRREQVGFIFQQFYLIPHLTALENVMVPLELLGGARSKEALELARDLLKQLGLGARLHHLPKQLSGGEQQRVAIARAFVNQPKVLFADEPTGNLDFATSARVIDALFALNEQFKTTLILVTHDLKLAQRCAHGVELREGEIVGKR
jgi:putative ABC transport system ATP-binding protein